jgi:hypothetical protein
MRKHQANNEAGDLINTNLLDGLNVKKIIHRTAIITGNKQVGSKF